MVVRSEVVGIQSQDDILKARQRARTLALEVGFSLTDQTRIVTAASELARNTVMHGGGGTVTFTITNEGSRRRLTLAFRDEGPGIADVERALTDGYTTGTGLGLGLGGARRLMSDFHIESTPGKGTTVTVTRWR